MWQSFLTWLSGIGHVIMTFVSPLAMSIAKNGGPVLVQAATNAVAAAEQPGLTSDQKKAAAVAAVVSTLKTQGIPVVMNAVNGAIESAVAGLQASQAALAPPVAQPVTQASADPSKS